MQWLHANLAKIHNWWKNLSDKNLPLFLILSGALAGGVWILSKIADKIFDEYSSRLQWGWIMNVFWVAVYLGAALLCWREYKKSKTIPGKQLSFWTGWGMAIFFAVLFTIEKVSKPTNSALIPVNPQMTAPSIITQLQPTTTADPYFSDTNQVESDLQQHKHQAGWLGDKMETAFYASNYVWVIKYFETAKNVEEWPHSRVQLYYPHYAAALLIVGRGDEAHKEFSDMANKIEEARKNPQSQLRSVLGTSDAFGLILDKMDDVQLRSPISESNYVAGLIKHIESLKAVAP